MSDVNSCLQSVRSCLVEVLASVGISRRACEMQRSKLGGSLGTITGEPGLWEAWLFAATYIQWLNAWVVIGLPATSATELPAMPLPHPATTAESAKKAPSAAVRLRYLRIKSG